MKLKVKTMLGKVSLVFFSFILVFASCSTNEDGNWHDNIKLSVKNIEFSAEADSTIVTTQGDWWWIDGVEFNDSVYTYHNRDDIDLESDHYRIVEDEFVIERRDQNTLFVKLDTNTTGDERVMQIYLQAGDYFDHITVRQSGE